MEFKFVVMVVLIYHRTLITAAKTNGEYKRPTFDEDYTNYEDIDELEDKFEDKFRQNDKELEFSEFNKNPQNGITREPPSYAITEEVDDIPNNTTVKVPIVTNYTLTIPLNTVPTIILNTTTEENNNENGNETYIGDSVKVSSRKNYISVLHIKAEYDNDKPDITIVQNNSPFPVLNGFREYIKGIRQGIINGIQSFVNKDKVQNTNVVSASASDNVAYVHNIVSAPVVFWNRLHSKSSDFVKKVHEGFSGRNF